MNDSLVCKRYELAQQVYAAHGVDTEQAMAAIDAIPISMHSRERVSGPAVPPRPKV